MSRLQHLRPAVIAAALAAAWFLGGSAAPAHADDRGWRGSPPRHWHDGRGWHRDGRPYPYYVASQPIYAPPPVVYAPPPPPPGINLIIPFNFR